MISDRKNDSFTTTNSNQKHLLIWPLANIINKRPNGKLTVKICLSSLNNSRTAFELICK